MIRLFFKIFLIYNNKSFSFKPTLLTINFLILLGIVFFIVLAFGNPFDFKSIITSKHFTKVRPNNMTNVKLIIRQNNTNKTVIEASTLSSVEGKQFVFNLKNINSHLLVNNKKISIDSSSGIINLVDSNILFSNNVNINYYDNISLNAKNLTYNFKSKIIEINELYNGTLNNLQIKSKNLIIDNKNSIIKSNNRTILKYNTK